MRTGGAKSSRVVEEIKRGNRLLRTRKSPPSSTEIKGKGCDWARDASFGEKGNFEGIGTTRNESR